MIFYDNSLPVWEGTEFYEQIEVNLDSIMQTFKTEI